MMSFNERFLEMWGIADQILEERDDRKSISSILEKLQNPDQFVAKIEYLMVHPEENSQDLIQLKDGRIIYRYFAPIQVMKEGSRGRPGAEFIFYTM